MNQTDRVAWKEIGRIVPITATNRGRCHYRSRQQLCA